MKLFVARHGETTWNALEKVCGRTDVPLTERGWQQAQALAREAAEQGIEVIIASPLQRAQDTARAVAQLCGVPVETDARLIEQDYGAYEGAERYDAAFLQNKRQFAWRYPGGESMMQLAARVYPLLDEVRRRYDGQKVLLVCHGGVMRVIHTYFCDMTNEKYFSFLPDNARLAVYDYPQE